MSDIAGLRKRALYLLKQQRLTPSLERDRLRNTIDELGVIIEQLKEQGEPALPILGRVQDEITALESRILLALNDERAQSPLIKPGLERALYAVAGLSRDRVQKGYIIPNETQGRILSQSGVNHTPFKHIPYSYAGRDSREALTESRLERMIEKTYLIEPFNASADLQWNLELVGKGKVESQGRGVRIGIADSGANYNHPALEHSFGEEKGYDFVRDDEDPMDENGHGTHVAGTIAGRGVGLAPEATLYALRFLDASGYGTEAGFIRAAEWAIDHELDVLNGSFGSSRASAAERAICDALQAHGVIFCAAAGNNGTSSYSYPASYDSVISVAAVDKHKRRAGFSQYNDQVSIAAPGVDVNSAYGGGYKELSGTSMACPHIAGGLALILEQRGDPARAKDVLLSSTEDLGDRLEYGSGLLRVDQALRVAQLLGRWAA